MVNAAAYDFRLTARSPCIDKGVDPGKADGIDLRRAFSTSTPARREIRPVRGPLDVAPMNMPRRAGDVHKVPLAPQ